MNATSSVAVDQVESETPRTGRGGRRPGAGRKPNLLKQLTLRPISAAEIIARRHPLSERLSPEELAMLHALTKKLGEPSPDASRNQKESNREVKSPVTSHPVRPETDRVCGSSVSRDTTIGENVETTAERWRSSVGRRILLGRC